MVREHSGNQVFRPKVWTMVGDTAGGGKVGVLGQSSGVALASRGASQRDEWAGYV